VNLQPCKRLNRRSKVKITAVREIVLADGFALVTAVRRESWQTTPAEDQWLVYSVSTQSGDARKLLIGYDLQIKDWFGFTLKDKDLGVIYLDCDECEPASLFTALHYDPREVGARVGRMRRALTIQA